MALFISSYTIINIFDYAVFYDILLYDKTRILSWFFVKKKKKSLATCFHVYLSVLTMASKALNDRPPLIFLTLFLSLCLTGCPDLCLLDTSATLPPSSFCSCFSRAWNGLPQYPSPPTVCWNTPCHWSLPWVRTLLNTATCHSTSLIPSTVCPLTLLLSAFS